MIDKIYKKIDRDAIYNYVYNMNEILFNPIKNKHSNYKKHYNEKQWREFNNLEYRCDEFKKEHDGKHILFMGCSETQGSNHGLDEAWAYILYTKIAKDEKLSGYFNISQTGHGIPFQILTMMQYIDNYGKPDEIIFLTPDGTRSFIMYDNRKNGTYQLSPVNMAYCIDENIENFTENELLNVNFNSILLMKFLESFCKQSKIELIWSTYNSDFSYIIEKMNFNNYFSLNIEKFNKNLLNEFDKYADKSKSIEYNLLKSDGHKGLVFHNYWAEKFYDKRKYEKNNKKN